MSSRYPHKRLASGLASQAREIAGTRGDSDARVLVYESLLRRWEPNLPLQNVREAHSVEQTLNQSELDAARGHYLAHGMDPAIYFYEEFLRACDPIGSKTRGVNYSPPEVAAFMVRAVMDLLTNELDADPAEAVVIDPCCGIGTFLRQIERLWQPPPTMIGVELDQAACQLCKRLIPKATVYNTDWLYLENIDTGKGPLVVIGNPPYSGHSANPGGAAELIADYRRGLAERNPKWLQDDYVKFIRVAQHRVKQAGRGIVAFITNHSYLYNPTFRQMRSTLLEDFDLVYTMDLQGNARRNDDGFERDENVFPIQTGVAISFMIRTSDGPGCTVRCAQLRGTRADKLSQLRDSTLSQIHWHTAGPAEPFFAFVPGKADMEAGYWRMPSVLDFFRTRSVGFVTSRDRFAVDTDRTALITRVAALRDGRLPDEAMQALYSFSDAELRRARDALQENPGWENSAVQVLYRPFDVRWAYYSREIMERPRLPFMKNMMTRNIAIVVGRAGQATGSATWDVAFCADRPVDLNLFRRGGATVLPRYLWTERGRTSNITQTPLDHDVLFNYIYAIIYSLEYRKRYADFLKLDYPRVPICDDIGFVSSLAALGKRLLELHLMRTEPAKPVTTARMTVGGYDIPGKFMRDRRETGMTQQETEHVERVRGIVAETASIQRQIGDLLASRPPWGK